MLASPSSTAQPGREHGSSTASWVVLGAVAVALGLILRAAWVTEDAYITLRTVDNLVHGYGLRWNTDERVQSFTHPLWMMLLGVAYAITRESFVTTIMVGIVTTAAALFVLVRSARSSGHAIAGVVLLTLSLGFVHYSTSGLENPLTHLLVGVFVYQYAVRRTVALRWLSLTVALLALSRIDAVLAVLPAFLHAMYVRYDRQNPRLFFRELLLGFSPWIGWELFSLFYYGFPVPNTAYAKLNTGLPRNEVLRQGVTYLLNAVSWDLPILMVTSLGIATAFLKRRPGELLLALGVLLYVVYVVWIGGDFMIGRFLTLPLFLAVCLLVISDLPIDQPATTALLVLPFVLLFVHPAATEKYPVGQLSHSSGVADERSCFSHAQLMYFERTHRLPTHDWVTDGLRAKDLGLTRSVVENVGFYGFYAGPRIHITDPLALTDPLLARLPATYTPDWRVGHYRRELPSGYATPRPPGTCLMPDRQLCEYDKKLREVVSGDLWSWSRLKTIVAFNLGAYEHLIDRQRYRFPRMIDQSLSSVSRPIVAGSPWNGPGVQTFGDHGIRIALGRLSHDKTLLTYLDANDSYELEFFAGQQQVGELASPKLEIGQMQRRSIAVPAEAARVGFDTLIVRPLEGDGMYSIGDVRLVR